MAVTCSKLIPVANSTLIRRSIIGFVNFSWSCSCLIYDGNDGDAQIAGSFAYRHCAAHRGAGRRHGPGQGHGHILRRRRRLRHNGWVVRVREPVRHGVRQVHGGAEHGSVQRRLVVRAVLPDHVRLRVVAAVVPARRVRDRHGDQLLPAQLRTPRQQRRLVQPAARALRHVAAGVGDYRDLPGRYHPRAVPARAVRQAGRRALHHQRVQLQRAGAHHQRRRQRVRGERVGPGQQNQPSAHEQELGSQLAVARGDRRPGAHLRRHVL